MTTGTIIRLVIFTVCLVIYAWHALTQFAYQTGITAQNDIRAVIATHQDKEFLFTLDTPFLDSKNNKLYYRIYTKETFYVIQIRLVMRDLPVTSDKIEAVTKMLPTDKFISDSLQIIKESGSNTINGSFELLYDNKVRFSGAQGVMDALGISCRLEIRVDHLGLHSQLAIPGLSIIEKEDYPDFNPDNFHGPILLLPPGLKNGDRLHLEFFGKIITVDMGLEEVLRLSSGNLNVRQAVVSYEERPYARLWLDDRGVIYQVTFESNPVKIILLSINDLAGKELWHRNH